MCLVARSPHPQICEDTMAAYQLVVQLPGMTMQSVQRMADQAFIPFDPANRDYQEYLQWLEAGNTPDPAPDTPSAA